MSKVCVKDDVVVKVIDDNAATDMIPEGATVIDSDIEVGNEVTLDGGVPVVVENPMPTSRIPESI